MGKLIPGQYVRRGSDDRQTEGQLMPRPSIAETLTKNAAVIGGIGALVTAIVAVAQLARGYRSASGSLSGNRLSRGALW